MLKERARKGFDEVDAEIDEPKLERGTRSPQPSREDCNIAALANESPTVRRSESLREHESPTLALGKERRIANENVDENEDAMRDDEPPPLPRRSRHRQQRDEN